MQSAVTTEFYPVSGMSAAGIFESIGNSSPEPDAVGVTEAEWDFDWQTVGGDGECAILSMTILLDMAIVLPRHTSPEALAPGLRAKWETYVAEVETHEHRHVDIYLEDAEHMRDRMLGLAGQPSCSALNAAVDRAQSDELARIRQQQEAFHYEEDLLAEAKRRDIQDEIDRLAGELDGLEVSVQRLEGDIMSMDDEMDDIERRVGTVDYELDSLKREADHVARMFDISCRDGNDSYLCQSFVDRYDAAVEEYNALIDERELSVGRYNDVVERRTAAYDRYKLLVSEYNGLVERINGLQEDLLWL